MLPLWTRAVADRYQTASGKPVSLGIAWWQVLALYAAAKALEMFDHHIWKWSAQMVSGHNLKHMVAAAAVLPVLWAIRRVCMDRRTDNGL